MKVATIKDLGKKISTVYRFGMFSFITYEKGYIIKPVKQKQIVLEKEVASCLCDYMNRVFDEELTEREI